MLPRQFFDEAPHGASFTALRLFKTTADAPESLQELMVLNKFLISFRTLDNDLGMAVHRQHRRISRLLQPADKAFGVPLKVTQGVNIFKVHHTCNLHYIYCDNKSSWEGAWRSSLEGGPAISYSRPFAAQCFLGC